MKLTDGLVTITHTSSGYTDSPVSTAVVSNNGLNLVWTTINNEIFTHEYNSVSERYDRVNSSTHAVSISGVKFIFSTSDSCLECVFLIVIIELINLEFYL